MTNKMLTTKQVAEMFGVKERTILYNFIPRGLKYFAIGSKDYRFDIKDIEAFVEREKKVKIKEPVFIDNRTEYQKKMNKKLRVV